MKSNPFCSTECAHAFHQKEENDKGKEYFKKCPNCGRESQHFLKKCICGYTPILKELSLEVQSIFKFLQIPQEKRFGEYGDLFPIIFNRVINIHGFVLNHQTNKIEKINKERDSNEIKENHARYNEISELPIDIIHNVSLLIDVVYDINDLQKIWDFYLRNQK